MVEQQLEEFIQAEGLSVKVGGLLAVRVSGPLSRMEIMLGLVLQGSAASRRGQPLVVMLPRRVCPAP